MILFLLNLSGLRSAPLKNKTLRRGALSRQTPTCRNARGGGGAGGEIYISPPGSPHPRSVTGITPTDKKRVFTDHCGIAAKRDLCGALRHNDIRLSANDIQLRCMICLRHDIRCANGSYKGEYHIIRPQRGRISFIFVYLAFGEDTNMYIMLP